MTKVLGLFTELEFKTIFMMLVVGVIISYWNFMYASFFLFGGATILVIAHLFDKSIKNDRKRSKIIKKLMKDDISL